MTDKLNDIYEALDDVALLCASYRVNYAKVVEPITDVKKIDALGHELAAVLFIQRQLNIIDERRPPESKK